jgi:hypothetical protein
VVDAREGDRELVIGVADVREVRVYAPHDLGGEMNVYVALCALVLVVHTSSIATRAGDGVGVLLARRHLASRRREFQVGWPVALRSLRLAAHKIIAGEPDCYRDRLA